MGVRRLEVMLGGQVVAKTSKDKALADQSHMECAWPRVVEMPNNFLRPIELGEMSMG